MLRLLLLLSLLLASPAQARDRFRNFEELKKACQEGRDYRIRVEERGGQGAVLAIHGGNIEADTAELAIELAGQDLDLYVFEAVAPGLHLTSSHFDEPRALALARKNPHCITVHGMAEKSEADPEVCIGGATDSLRQKTATELRASGIRVEEPCRRLPGKDPRNVVNLCKEGGVQLEMSQSFRRKLRSDSALRKRWIQSLRRVVLR